jgi:hypothetical protein
MQQMAAYAADGKTIGPEEVDAYLAKRKKGLTKPGIIYWLISRLQFGGVPYLGDRPLPKVNIDCDRIALPTFLEENSRVLQPRTGPRAS